MLVAYCGWTRPYETLEIYLRFLTYYQFGCYKHMQTLSTSQNDKLMLQYLRLVLVSDVLTRAMIDETLIQLQGVIHYFIQY